MANLLTTSLTIRSIWGERFLCRRFSGYLDPLLPTDLFRPFLKKFVLIATDSTCHSRARIYKNAHMLAASAAKWLVLWLN